MTVTETSAKKNWLNMQILTPLEVQEKYIEATNPRLELDLPKGEVNGHSIRKFGPTLSNLNDYPIFSQNSIFLLYCILMKFYHRQDHRTRGTRKWDEDTRLEIAIKTKI